MDKRSVLLVGNFLSARTGTMSVIEEISDRLAARGWTVIETSRRLAKPLRLADMLLTTFRRRNDYEVARVDVYSGAAFRGAEIVVQLLSRLGKPVVMSLHGGGLAEFADRHPDRVRRLFARARIVTTPSLFLKAALSRYEPDIRYLPNAVDVTRYHFRVRHAPAPNFVWLRAFHRIYEPALAVRAVAPLARDYEGLALTMVGPDKRDGSLAATLEEARRSGVSAKVRITGPVPKREVPEHLAGGDIFLNTTTYESFGVAVLEAALSGLPIVTTSAGELPLLWDQDETALLVPRGDAAGMTDAIRRLLSEPGLSERLSRNARARAEQFDWEVILPHWENMLVEAAQ